VIFYSAAVGLALFVVGGLIGYLMTRPASPPAVAQPSPLSPEDEQTDSPIEPSAEPPAEPAAEEPAAGQAQAGEGDNAASVPAVPELPGEKGPAGAPKKAAADGQPANPGAAQAGAVPDPAADDQAGAERRAGVDLLDLLPEEADVPRQGEPEPEEKPRDIEQILADDPEAGSLPGDEPDGGMAAGPTESRAAISSRAERAADAPAEIDLEQRLALRLPMVQYREIPLADVVDDLSAVTLLPISFDLPAFAEAGIDAQKRVTVDQRDTPLATVLTSLLAPHGLTFVVEENQVVISSLRSAERELQTVAFPIDDLASDQREAEQLAHLMQQAVAPHRWASRGGPGQIAVKESRLAISQTRPVIFRLVVFSEKLRLARGLDPRSRFAPERYRLTSRSKPVEPQLHRELTLTFHQPAPLRRVLQHIEGVSGLRILIDWRSLAAADFDPLSRITCAIEEKPAGEALTALLAPLGLAWQVAGDKTVEVFSRSDMPRKMQVEFYPVGSILDAGVSLERLLGDIRNLAGEAAWQKDGTALLHFDKPSRYLIVRHISPVQAEIESHLQSRRERLMLGMR